MREPRQSDLVFVSMEHWDQVWRRNQFLCAAYARRHPDRKVLFVAPPVDISHAIRRRDISSLRKTRTWTVPQYANITVTQPLKLAPNSLGAGRRLNEAMSRAHIRRIAGKLGIRTPVLWLNPHWAVHMVGRFPCAMVVYDITDDWTALTQSAAEAQLIREQDAALCRRADAVIVCSRRLYELKSQLGAKKLQLIPNGVDAEHYRLVTEGAGPLPAGADRWPRPVLGYTGTIHPDRVDVDMLVSLANNWRGSIVLIGPNQLRPSDMARLKQSNIFFPGIVPYDQIPNYMRAFDVCIVPHRMTPFTESLNPIKLWEYLAAGKPIVSTDISGFRDYPDLVYIARDVNQFLQAAQDALNEDQSRAGARRSEAAHHSWISRLDQVEALFDPCASSQCASPRTERCQTPAGGAHEH